MNALINAFTTHPYIAWPVAVLVLAALILMVWLFKPTKTKVPPPKRGLGLMDHTPRASA